MCYLFGLEYVGAVIEPCHDEAAKKEFRTPCSGELLHCVVVQFDDHLFFFFFFKLS